ncbi:MAG: metallophosphatase domain-containing protein [Methylobacter sp.]|uniref:metallophosphatase domain-containing protein n=1 Tax=Methylobacter sp. TaxID=2051955 RepID=UPI0027313BC5|nr:metallophosphatase domain-containing protein [Methylobacter sp.]MDP1666123.1 metallophosphatase domain-containing protein [Methylobacter sp.]
MKIHEINAQHKQGSQLTTNSLRLVCMSDLHSLNYAFPVPDGDVLIIAGDICGYGSHDELKKFDDFLSGLPHKHKLLIAGNHDWPFARVDPSEAKLLVKNAIYLMDSGIEIEGIKFWGSPWQPFFCNWAFNLPRGPELAKVWANIPDNIDVLITHGPPYGILDEIYNGERVGCQDLSDALERVKPKVHVFGHIHEGYGMLKQNGTTYVNASLCNQYYQLVHSPIVIEV